LKQTDGKGMEIFFLDMIADINEKERNKELE